MTQTTVLGAGSFGTALATLFARQGAQRVVLWSHRAEQAEAMNTTRHNPRYLSDYELPEQVEATADIEAAVADADRIVLAMPSQVVREHLVTIRTALPEVPLILASKGMETSTLMTLDEVVADVLGEGWKQRTLALSGPSFAKELMDGHPTAVVLASSNEGLADTLCRELCFGTFRAYSSGDIVGVELGGALKNVMAIAAGAVTGMGFGSNTLTAIITRGLAEITRLAVAKGAHPMTLAGLAGMGDLVLTCTGGLSRNRSVGEKLGQGKSIEQALEEIGQVAEGIKTTAAAHALAGQLNVEAPITEAVHRVLYEAVPIQIAVKELLARPFRREREY